MGAILKKLLFITYISIVVGLSLAARAELYHDELPLKVVPLFVSEGLVNDATESIDLMGQYSDICTTTTGYELKYDEVHNALVLDVKGIREGHFCAAVMGSVFQLSIPLSQIKSQLDHYGMDANSSYLVMTPESGFKAQINFEKVESGASLQSLCDEVNTGEFTKPTLSGAMRPVIVQEPVFY